VINNLYVIVEKIVRRDIFDKVRAIRDIPDWSPPVDLFGVKDVHVFRDKCRYYVVPMNKDLADLPFGHQMTMRVMDVSDVWQVIYFLIEHCS
jgi:hypothetical protein